MMSANICHWLYLWHNEHMDIFVTVAEREATYRPNPRESLGLT